jgi:hypothetical protein
MVERAELPTSVATAYRPRGRSKGKVRQRNWKAALDAPLTAGVDVNLPLQIAGLGRLSWADSSHLTTADAMAMWHRQRTFVRLSQSAGEAGRVIGVAAIFARLAILSLPRRALRG